MYKSRNENVHAAIQFTPTRRRHCMNGVCTGRAKRCRFFSAMYKVLIEVQRQRFGARARSENAHCNVKNARGFQNHLFTVEELYSASRVHARWR